MNRILLASLMVCCATLHGQTVDENEMTITQWSDHVTSLIESQQINELERLGQLWRGQKGDLPRCRDGQSRLMAMYDAQRRFEPGQKALAKRFRNMTEKWRAAHPSSTVCRVMEAVHLSSFAWSNEPPAKRVEAHREAEKLLLEAGKLAGRSADWYTALVNLAISGKQLEMWDKAYDLGFRSPEWLKNALQIAEEGIRRFPDHSMTYFRVAGSARLLGFDGNTDAWARHVCTLLPNRGLEPYTRTMWSMEPIWREKLFKEPGYGDWPTFRQGFFDLLKNGADTPRNTGWFLVMARRAEDKATANQLLEKIGDQPDAEVFAIESRFKEIKAWATTDAPKLAPLWERKARDPQSLAWSQDGKTLYVGCRAQPLSLLNAETGEIKELWDMQPEAREINEVAVSPDGSLVAAASGEEMRDQPGWCRVWEAQTGKPVVTFRSGKGSLNTLAFSSDSNELVCGGGSYDGPSEAWHWVRGGAPVALEWASQHKHPIYALAWAPDASALVFNCNNSRVTVAENAKELRLVKQKATPGISNASALAFSPDGKFLAAALRFGWGKRDQANGCIAIFHSHDMQPRTDTVPPLTGGLLTLDYSPDGRWIAAGGYDGYIYLLDSLTLEMVTWWNGGHGLLYKLRWSPDGQFLASAADGDKVAVWPIRFEKP